MTQLESLKAEAYDAFVAMQAAQNKLIELNKQMEALKALSETQKSK